MRRPRDRRSRSALAAVALVPRLEMLRYATASGYVDPDGIGSLLFGDRRGARRALRRLALRDRDALHRRRHARARAASAGAAARGDGAPGAAARRPDRALARVGGRPRRLAHGSAPARAHRRRPRARARHRARAAVRERAGRVRAARARSAGRARSPSARSGSSVGVARGRHRRLRAQLPDPARGACAPCFALAPTWSPLAPLARCCVVLGGDLAWQATHQDRPLRWLRAVADRAGAGGQRARSCSRGSAARGRSASPRPRPSRCSCTSSARIARRAARALLLDQEALRLGLEDVAGYNPVHLKRYKRADARLERRARGRPPLRARAALRDAAAALARRALLRLAAGRVAAGPAGRLPRPPERRHARRRGAAVRAHRARRARARRPRASSRASPIAS